MAADILSVVFSFALAFALRKNIRLFYTLDLFPQEQVLDELSAFSKYLNILPLLLFSWWFFLKAFGLYESFRRKSFLEIISAIIKSAFFVMFVFSTAAFLFKLHFVSRSFMAILFIITSLFLIFERWIIVLLLRFFRKKGYNYRNILVVGTGKRAQNFIGLVDKHPEWGLRIVGLIDAEKAMLGKAILGKEVIGLLEDIPRILGREVIDEVIFIVPRAWLSMIEKSLIACETQGIRTNIAADFFNTRISRSMYSEIEGIPILEFKTTAGEEWQLLLKRLFDIMFSSVVLIAVLPLFAVLAIVIKRFCGGPVIFSQIRSGVNGRPFVMYKFRTMVNGADGKKHELTAFNELNGPAFKMRNDPRITGFGRFLRRTSLDELPQLFNVFKGEMSIVGPRPPVPSEVDRYKLWQRRRLSMKPGLTCLWQINGRNNVDFDKWMKLDLEYIDNWSLRLDFNILLKTIPAVIFSIGAR